MELKVDIGFEQLLQLIKQLPENQLLKLKKAISETNGKNTTTEEFKKLLLNGPVFTEGQIEEIEETRKAINQWRKN